MAERIEPSPYYEARPHAEFQFPNDTVLAGSKWIDTVINARDLKLTRGFAGSSDFYEGLNEIISRRIEAVLELHCGDDCRMDIDSGFRRGDSGTDYISVELNCGPIRAEHEEVVDDKAAKCAEHYEKCQRTLGEWLIATELEIQERKAKIFEAQVEIRAQQDRIRDLT